MLLLVIVGPCILIRTPPAKRAPALEDPQPQQPRFSVSDFRWESSQYGNRYLIGTLTSNTGKTYSYVQVEINLYDQSGAQVGSTLANVNNLEPYAAWKFRAPVLEDRAKDARVADITAF